MTSGRRASPGASARPVTALHGPALWVSRGVWLVVVAASLTVSVLAFSAAVRLGVQGVLGHRGFLEVTDEVLDFLNQLGLSPGGVLGLFLTTRAFGLAVFAVTGLVIFALRSDDRMTLLVSGMLVTVGAAIFAPLALVVDQYPRWAATAELVGIPAPPWIDFGRSLAGISLLLVLYLAPDGRFVPRWTRFVAAALLAEVVLWTAFPGSVFDVGRWPWYQVWVAGLPATGLFAQVYRYAFVSGPLERRQTWLVVSALVTGFAASFLLTFLNPELGGGIYDLVVVTPELAAFYELILLVVLGGALLAFPVSIAVSVLRYRLWDLDVIINRALVYGALTGLVASAGLLAVFVLGGVFGGLLGPVVGPELALVGSTVLLTLGFQPARRRVQAVVDRSFFRRKYDATKTLETFSDRLRQEVDLESLVGDLLEVVDQTMQPAQASLWLQHELDGGPFRRWAATGMGQEGRSGRAGSYPS